VDIPWSDKKHYAIGIGLMLAVVLVLGVRSKATVDAVLADKAPVEAASTEHKRLVNDEMSGVTYRDSLVAIAHLAEDLIDPFLGDKALPQKVAAKAPPRVARLIKPRLAALIFDDVDPTVQIRVAGERSNWLHTGDRFKGWQVAEIDSKSVKVKKGDREVVLK
jgi:hypothetical protein